jgi:hypothetical protein
LHRKSSFRSAGFQYTHGNALSVEGSFSFKDANDSNAAPTVKVDPAL